MKVIQCEKGHFYDAEKYDECPVCRKIENKKTDPVKTEKIKDINDIDLNKLKECEEATQIISSNYDEPPTMKPDNKAVSEKIIDYDLKAKRPNDDGETQVSFWKNEVIDESETSDCISNPQDNEVTQVLGGYIRNDTVGISSVKKRYNGPIVGWLVAINGPHKGQSFELYAKKNYIGRGDDSVVCLSNDKTVSRTSPLCVIFDNRKSEFIAVAGNSDQTAYVNDQLLLQPINLKLRDCIVLGESSLLFIPFITKENDFENTYLIGKR